MDRPANYNTRQWEAIISYFASLGGNHVTAAQIVTHFENEKVPIGRTTVYRHLEKLTEIGVVRKYTIDGITGSYFQYIDKAGSCRTHLHLKCENCGALIHLNCDMLDEIRKHMFNQHAF